MARLDDRVVGFVTGYLRPERPDTLFVWQVAVDEAARGRRAAATMLDDLVARVGVPYLETTVTDDNAASLAVSRRLGYRDNGVSLMTREGVGRADTLVHVRLTTPEWAAAGHGRGVRIEGLEPARFLFGL